MVASDRQTPRNLPLRPTLASNRSTRTPITPRVAGSATPQPRPLAKSTSSTSLRSEPARPTARGKQEQTPGSVATGSAHVTPRSSVRKSRVDGSLGSAGSVDDTPTVRPKSVGGTTSGSAERKGSVVSSVNAPGLKSRVARPMSLATPASTIKEMSPPPQGLGLFVGGRPAVQESIDSRFFHANDASKQEAAPKKPELKRAPTFFYADGQEEQRSILSPSLTSPGTSVISEKIASTSWARHDELSFPPRSPPKPSPVLSTISTASSFFPSAPRSPSPTKENIHLSYRKGVSQIFGTRPSPRTPQDASESDGRPTLFNVAEEASNAASQRRTPSVSSIDSGNSPQSRRKSASCLEPASTSCPGTHEIKPAADPPSKSLQDPPNIDTSFSPRDEAFSPPAGAMSPTRGVSELAAEARRERKVLDLEISNSSLLAINASLERELRRQKAELKRFRRLSRAGRFSIGAGERAARFSEGLTTLSEEEDGDEFSLLSQMSGFDAGGEFSDDDDEESTLSSEPMSPGPNSRRQSDRLAKDERRLQVDLARHKELLVQSQMMNQSIKRCMYAAETMIADGEKALAYQVRVSDVKLGGRILSSHDDEEDETSHHIEVDDGTLHEDYSIDAAEGFLKVWQGVGRPSFEGSSEGGDRDSGIEVDKPLFSPPRNVSLAGSGRPLDRIPYSAVDSDTFAGAAGRIFK
ncbi:Hypothetical protein R9X50_00028000 [Acrodontium crateriforme]|uniref:Uncharacterized protein n=1 Tax=Acrodontium crateriforme TaxID=150365 RepID=A0AAQ3LX43_9PEZI|nr:Hypothetical protein R9X50_00028000 [Acrodontium crateriforme]